MKTGTSKVDPDHNVIFANSTVQFIIIHTEAAQGHNIGIITATTEAAHDVHAPPIEVTTPEITVDHTHDHPTNFKVRLA